MRTEISSKNRILAVAAELFFRQGFQKTSLDEVAFSAGVTRVTVYRHFGDKRGLVGAVCEAMAAVYRQAEAECRDFPQRSLAECLSHAREHFAWLPKNHLGPGFEELGRVYPDLFAALRATYRAAMDGVFDELLRRARQSGELREGLQLDLVKAIFWEAVLRLLETPTAVGSGASGVEVFDTVAEVLQHGILQPKKAT